MAMTILVPLDGSSLAERALPYAAAIARRAGASLVLMRVAAVLPLPGYDNEQALRHLERQARKELADVAARLAAEGVDAKTQVYRGDAAIGIDRAAEDVHAHLVVMSTHGRGGLGRWFYNSVADGVLRRAKVAVFLIPPNAPPTWPAEERLRFLVPLDGSDLSETALQPAAELAGRLGARLILLRVVEPSLPIRIDWSSAVPTPATPEGELERRVDEARSYLEDAATRCQVGATLAEVRVEIGDPAQFIAEAAQAAGVHGIVMATHGRTGLARAVMGSVASATLQHASVPVVLMRPAAMRQVSPEVAEIMARAAEEEAAKVTITLAPRERELAMYALEHLLLTLDRGTEEFPRVQALVARLQQASMQAVGASSGVGAPETQSGTP